MGEALPVVYIVDDDPSVRKSLQRLLTVAGYQPVTFGSAREYLQAERSSGPACLVLDIRLPGMSGLELQEILAAEKATPPIVFITGHGDIPMSVKAIKAGAVDFLAKPFSDEAFIRAVEQALERSRRESAVREEMNNIYRRLDRLTPREREVLYHVVRGKLNKQIAAELGVSEKTVKVHRGHMMQKLEVQSLVELVRLLEKVDRYGSEEKPS